MQKGKKIGDHGRYLIDEEKNLANMIIIQIIII